MISKRQLGMGSLNMLFFMVVGAGVALFLFKVVPAQFNNTYVQTALKSIKNNEGSLSELSDRQITKQLSSFFSLNNIDTKLLSRVKIERESDRVLINLNYEVRESFYRNIQIVTNFENQWDSTRPQACCKPAK